MNEPSDDLLIELAEALREASHRNVAEHFLAGLLWAIYPEWFDLKFKTEKPKNKKVLQ